MVDDYHLLSVGAKQDDTNGYYLTEESGETLCLVPYKWKASLCYSFYDLKTTNELINSFKILMEKCGYNFLMMVKKNLEYTKTYETVYEKNG